MRLFGALRAHGSSGTAIACLAYTAVAVVATWPVVLYLSRDIAGDLGDPLLNCWILAWNADHFLRALSGHPAALATLWHGNIFHPEPYTLAYSELLLAQSLQILPVYALTHNIILCYNLLFLSSFVLSALGMFLLVRSLTGHTAAAWVAGLIFGFLPYRIDQLPHLQVVSAQWMPFVLFGFRRYFETGRRLPLAGAALALMAQNLSCGYFLVYFSVFVPPYVLFEMWSRRLLREWRVWTEIAAAGAAVALVTVATMHPYLALREVRGMRRSLDEVIFYSADALAYFTATDRLWLWGRTMLAWPAPEGQLFPGLVALILAVVGIAAGVRQSRQYAVERIGEPQGRWEIVRRIVVHVCGLFALVHAAAGVAILLGRGGIYQVGSIVVKLASARGAFARGSVFAAIVLLLSPYTRRLLRRLPVQPVLFFALMMALAWWMSLGPIPSAAKQPLGLPGLYRAFFDYVPGFDGLRVPARYGMVVMFFVAIVAGYGFAALARRWPRGDTALATVASVVIVAEALVIPFPRNLPMHAEGDLENPPFRVPPAPKAPAVYHYLARLGDDAVVVELPFGDIAWEIRYTYYSTAHWRRMLNGFSGYFPPSFLARRDVLAAPWLTPDPAWASMTDAGTTHVVVHTLAFPSEDSQRVTTWLEERGARAIAFFQGDVVYRLPSSGVARHGSAPPQDPPH